MMKLTNATLPPQDNRPTVGGVVDNSKVAALKSAKVTFSTLVDIKIYDKQAIPASVSRSDMRTPPAQDVQLPHLLGMLPEDDFSDQE